MASVIGLEIRRASWHDVIGVHDVVVEASRPLGETVFTLAQQRQLWEREGFAPEQDVRIAVDGERVVGFGELHADQSVLVRVAPEQEGAGTHEALLAELEDDARARGMQLVSAVVPAVDAAACRAYEDSGYVSEREVLRMWVEHTEEPPPAELPPGVAVRTYSESDAEDVHELLDEAYLGWDGEYVPVPHAEWLSSMTGDPDFDAGCWFLAEAQGRLAGVCLNWRMGWVKDLAVRPAWRRRGLGEALLRHAFHELWLKGVPRIGLKVDSTNATGAPRLYERLGFVTDRRYPLYTKQL